MNVLREMTHLWVARPAPQASAETISAWYAAKARLHAYLAEQGGPDVARELALAAAAHARSVRLSARSSPLTSNTGTPTIRTFT